LLSMSSSTDVIGLDVGDKKTGVARMSLVACLPEPLGVVLTADLSKHVREFVDTYHASLVVVGMPRSLDGVKTAQSFKVEQIVRDQLGKVDVPIVFQDETLSSVTAQSKFALGQRVNDDAHAACIILEDYARSSGLVQ
jgi:putative holliday junction resolvase